MINKIHLFILLSLISSLFLYSEEALLLAEKAFIEGDFEKAIELYQDIPNSNRGGPYYQNLSLFYYWQGEYAKSLEASHLSLFYKPLNPPLRDQQILIRSLLESDLAPPGKGIWEKIFFWYVLFPQRTWVLLFLFFWISFWSLIFLSKKIRNLNPKILIMFFTPALFICASSLPVYQSIQDKPIGVLIENTIIYKARGLFQDKLEDRYFAAGTEYKQLEIRGDWMLIELGDKRQGWVEIPE